MEELVGNQKPPAADVKVAKAQLEEQKLLRRLLEERRPRVERGLQEEPEREDVAALRQRWGRLLDEVQHRFVFLERIVPAAQRFQQGADSFQEWLAATERLLAQLWGPRDAGTA
ncbi:microtubule-actin cross-linking factor 1, isoforms 6/7-like [Lagopus muta]|uniref:microtubule-actin cross-linking factor 1, isoforms 6/7-like n=1 Tax=Lagopus muta TaxID=64668 RepID=UPI0020A23076|nr:microtubule-actin cross-linking factor 1, isoforms 6/7-like [Lagopus muta]